MVIPSREISSSAASARHAPIRRTTLSAPFRSLCAPGVARPRALDREFRRASAIRHPEFSASSGLCGPRTRTVSVNSAPPGTTEAQHHTRLRRSPMNTRTRAQLFRPSRLRAAGCIIAMVALHAIASAAVAQQPPAPVLDERVKVVSLTDLDLSTPAGAQAARQRVRETARWLCMRVQDPHDLGHQPHFVACVDRATAAAVRQIERSTLVAVDAPAPAHRRGLTPATR